MRGFQTILLQNVESWAELLVSMLSMLADYLWSGILKSANSFIHYIYRKSFWPACPTRYARCHICKVSCSHTKQTKRYVSSSLRMVDPECIAVCPNRQNTFYTFSTWPHTGDDKIKVPLLLYIISHSKTTSYIWESGSLLQWLLWLYI